MNLKDQLRAKGWYLTAEGIEECSENLDTPSDNAIIQRALDCDLRDIGEKFLPDDISRGRSESISGPGILQIQKIRNVSIPKLNNGYNNAPDLLRIQLTDGHTTCNAVQWGNWKSISQDIPPGTKLYLKPGKIRIQNSFLVLTENQLTVLGGNVSALIEKWELSRSLACHIRATTGSDGGPPPWIPFGQQIGTNSLKTLRGNFKSLEQTQKETKENEAFEQQRKANIAEIARTKEGKKKIFGGGKQIQEIDTNIPNYFSKSVNSNPFKTGSMEITTASQVGQIAQKNQTNNRGENKSINNSSSKQEQSLKKREKIGLPSDNILPSRPSGRSTLFDFLQSQISLPAESNNVSNDSSVNNTGSSMQPTNAKESNNPSKQTVQQPYHGKERSEKYKKIEKNGPAIFHSDQRNNPKRNYVARENESFHTSQSNYDKLNNDKYKSNLGQVYDNHSRNNTKNFRESERTKNRNYEKNPGNEGKIDFYSEGRNLNEKSGRGRNFNDNNERYSEKRSNRAYSYGDNQFHSSMSVPYKNTDQQFVPKQGEKVLAKYWEDNKLYPAVVHAASANGATCVVHFVDYGNYEEVLMKDVQPLTAEWNYNSHSSGNSSSNRAFPNGVLQQNFVGTLEFRRGGNKPYVHNTDTSENSFHGQKKEGNTRPTRQLYQPPAQRRHAPL